MPHTPNNDCQAIYIPAAYEAQADNQLDSAALKNMYGRRGWEVVEHTQTPLIMAQHQSQDVATLRCRVALKEARTYQTKPDRCNNYNPTIHFTP